MFTDIVLIKKNQLNTYSELPNLPIVDQMMFSLWGNGISQSLYQRKGEEQ